MKNLARLIPLSTLSFLLAHPAQALEVKGKELEIYGTLHPSLDYLDSSVSSAQADAKSDDKLVNGATSISFNSSKIGFRGVLATDVDGLSMVYQLEQNVTPDGSSTDTLDTRNTFAGLQTPSWTLIAGRHDTLFKDLALRHSLIKHSVADRGVILGAGAVHGNQLDRRAENMLLGRYFLPLGRGRLELQAQYSPDAVKSAGYADNNRRDLQAVGVEWKSPSRLFAVAVDHWSAFTIGQDDSEIYAIRACWRETGTHLNTSVILEHINQDAPTGVARELDRDAIALQASWKQGDWRYLGQVMKADSYDDSSATGATVYSLGAERSLTQKSLVYVITTLTDNEDNAAFQGVDGTHGDELATLAGHSPRATSVGTVINF
jgi:predicted porin